MTDTSPNIQSPNLAAGEPLLEGSTIQLLENGTIIYVKHLGSVEPKKAIRTMEIVMDQVRKAKDYLHIISDLTEATIPKETEQVLGQNQVVWDLQKEANYGIQTMVIPRTDENSQAFVNDYNTLQKTLVTPDGKMKRDVLLFPTVDIAKKFLIEFNRLHQKES